MLRGLSHHDFPHVEKKANPAQHCSEGERTEHTAGASDMQGNSTKQGKIDGGSLRFACHKETNSWLYPTHMCTLTL